MEFRELRVAGAYEITPKVHGDARGSFHEWFRLDRLTAESGSPFAPSSPGVLQANLSVSSAGTLRGIHFSRRPPSQAKYVTCFGGAVLDVIVDLREESPTFGQWDTVLLDTTDRRCAYLPEGLGHGFCALTDQATVAYLCSTSYDPDNDHGISPFDPELGIAWPTEDLDGRPLTHLLSAKDEAAPSLAEVRARGLLSPAS